jgi:hypothetical protein
MHSTVSEEGFRVNGHRVLSLRVNMNFQNVSKPPEKQPTYRCPCCAHLTLSERAGLEICPVCFWEDDGQDSHDADDVRGGPNGSLSLAQARQNFREFGAIDRKSLQHVRKPTPEET